MRLEDLGELALDLRGRSGDLGADELLEAGHAERGSTYSAGLEAYADGSIDGVKSWLLRCAAAVARGAELSPAGRR